jgi:hypothetical protein
LYTLVNYIINQGKTMDFQCDIIKVSGNDALATYQSLKTKTGVIPVILGDNDDIVSMAEAMDYITASFSQLLQQAANIDPLEWFSKRQAQDPQYYDLLTGAWQDLSPATDISVHLDILTGQPKADIYIALVPVEKSWMIPAFLKIGGWNECPTAAEHAAIFKYWDECYGITVAGITADVIELEVQRPPTTREQALQLAEQQFIYCPDIVYQGTETIAALASTLINGSVWFFWWD